MTGKAEILNDAEIEEILKEIESMPMKQAADVAALKIVQKHRGYVSDDALRAIAVMLDMTSDELDAVATFYNLIFRKPVGRHVILICDSISCWITGEIDMLASLEQKLGIKLGETTRDGMFTLLPSACLGHCDMAPVMMLDGEIIGNLTDEKIGQVLAKISEESNGE